MSQNIQDYRNERPLDSCVCINKDNFIKILNFQPNFFFKGLPGGKNIKLGENSVSGT